MRSESPPNSDGILTVVIPVYNEGENFRALFEDLKKSVRTPFRVLIVYDRDDDNTVPVVRALAADDGRLQLIKNPDGGVLSALRSGFAAAPPGPCLVVMGDRSDDLSAVDVMVERYRRGFKLVCASRYMPGGRHLGGPFVKRTLSRLSGLALYHLGRLPVHDATNNFRLYDKAMLEAIPIESRGGFEVALELTVKAARRGYPICEIPTTWQERTIGESRFKLGKWLPHYLKWFAYALRN